MRITRPLLFALCAAAVAAGPATGQSPVGHPRFRHTDVTASFSTTAAATYLVHGEVDGADDSPLDDVEVEAWAPDATEPAASAITYGGGYDLWLPEGSYQVRFHDLDGRGRDTTYPGTVALDVDAPATTDLDPVHLTQGSASCTASPGLTGGHRVGQVLHAGTGTWQPTTGLAYGYTWKVGDTVVGTGPSLVLRPAWVGRTARVVVAAEGAFWSTGTAASTRVTVAPALTHVDATGPVRAVPRGHAFGLRVHLSGGADAHPSGLVVATENGRRVGTAALLRPDGTLKVGALPVGRHTLRVTWTGSRAEAPSSDVVTVRVTR